MGLFDNVAEAGTEAAEKQEADKRAQDQERERQRQAEQEARAREEKGRQEAERRELEERTKNAPKADREAAAASQKREQESRSQALDNEAKATAKPTPQAQEQQAHQDELKARQESDRQALDAQMRDAPKDVRDRALADQAKRQEAERQDAQGQGEERAKAYQEAVPSQPDNTAEKSPTIIKVPFGGVIKVPSSGAGGDGEGFGGGGGGEDYTPGLATDKEIAKRKQEAEIAEENLKAFKATRKICENSGHGILPGPETKEWDDRENALKNMKARADSDVAGLEKSQEGPQPEGFGQERAFSCGQASPRDIIKQKTGKDPGESELRAQAMGETEKREKAPGEKNQKDGYVPGVGTGTVGVADVLAKNGVPATAVADPDALDNNAATINNGNPAVALTDGYAGPDAHHFVVVDQVIGDPPDYYVIRDPLPEGKGGRKLVTPDQLKVKGAVITGPTVENPNERQAVVGSSNRIDKDYRYMKGAADAPDEQ
jgi:hypothetical protein